MNYFIKSELLFTSFHRNETQTLDKVNISTLSIVAYFHLIGKLKDRIKTKHIIDPGIQMQQTMKLSR